MNGIVAATLILFPDSKSNSSRAVMLTQIQRHVDCVLRRLHELDLQLSLRDYYSAADLLQAYRTRRRNASLRNFCDSLSLELEKAGQRNTARAYRTVCRGFLSFVGRNDFLLADLDSHLLMLFERDLQNRGRQPNTISFYMRNLRAIYNKAMWRAVISRSSDNIFANVFTGVARTSKRALDAEGVKSLIRAVPNESLSLSRARRYFAFCFYACGMCFIDMAYLRKEDIQGDVLCYRRHKTGRRIELRLTPELHRIIKSFASETVGSPYLFPILTPSYSDRRCYESALRRQNRHLKRLASVEGMKAAVSTHWARHSWATLGKRAHIPIPILSECLGHSSEKVTRIYLDSFERNELYRANRRVASLVSYLSSVRS